MFQWSSTPSFATVKPAIPKSAVCASDTIPASAARNARLAATRPVQRTTTATALVKYVEKTTGPSTASTSTPATVAYQAALQARRRLTPPPRIRASPAGGADGTPAKPARLSVGTASG